MARPPTRGTFSIRHNGLMSLLLLLVVVLEAFRLFSSFSTAGTFHHQSNGGFLCMPMASTSTSAWRQFQNLPPPRAAQDGTSRSLSTTAAESKITDPQSVIIPETSSSSASSFSSALQDQTIRDIMMVHVGKAGGMSLRQNVAADCTMMNWKGTPDEKYRQLEECRRNFSPELRLSLQTRNVLHMWVVNQTAIADATSFLFTLRNPVDRIVSAFRYSHPENCLPGLQPRPAGCTLKESGALDNPERDGYKLFRQCFPHANMLEDLAHAVMNPYQYPSPYFWNELDETQRLECHLLAKKHVQATTSYRVVSHFSYNYQYYASLTVQKYPTKEVLAVRTEHELQDMVALDRQLLGGSGKFRYQRPYRHGSDKFPSTKALTEAAYHKLCCALEREIDIYLGLLHKAVNLNDTAKQETEDSLRAKCGLSKSTTSWMEWRIECLRSMDLAADR